MSNEMNESQPAGRSADDGDEAVLLVGAMLELGQPLHMAPLSRPAGVPLSAACSPPIASRK